MWLNKIYVIALMLALAVNTPAEATNSEGAALLQTVQQFYGWVLKHGQETRRFEPRVMQETGSTRLYLNQSSLDQYSDALMASGFFAPEFRSRVAGFYARSALELNKYSQSEFDEMAQDGRGPLIDSEDIDVFFCSQEAEYSRAYASGARLNSYKIKDDTATAVIITPDQWKTTFTFRKLKIGWRISGFCLYK